MLKGLDSMGYSPTMDEIMEDIGVTSPDKINMTIFTKAFELYHIALGKGKIEKYGTPHDFILCDSKDFYQTMVNLGYGSATMLLMLDSVQIAYFLMFEDKMPKEFRHIAASHEATEYKLLRSGLEQGIAHMESCKVEINTAKELGLIDNYLDFLKQNYPAKFKKLKKENII